MCVYVCAHAASDGWSLQEACQEIRCVCICVYTIWEEDVFICVWERDVCVCVWKEDGCVCV